MQPMQESILTLAVAIKRRPKEKQRLKRCRLIGDRICRWRLL